MQQEAFRQEDLRHGGPRLDDMMVFDRDHATISEIAGLLQKPVAITSGCMPSSLLQHEVSPR